MNKKVVIIGVRVVCFALACIYFYSQKDNDKVKEEGNIEEETPIKDEKTLEMIITDSEECTGLKKFYFESDTKRFYLVCSTGAWLVKGDKMSFSSAISSGIYSMEKIFSLYTKEEKEGYNLYTNNEARLIECNSGDVVIGPKDLEYKEEYCKRTCTFTRTFYILNVDDIDKEYFNITLMFGQELETVRVKKSLNTKYSINSAYEFTFIKDELDKINDTSLKSIFTVFALDSVKKSNVNDGNFVNESVCNIN